MSGFYHEEQRFNSILMWLIIVVSFIPVNVIFLYGSYQQLIMGEPWGSKPMSDTALLTVTLLTFFVSLVLVWLAFNTVLTLEIKDKTVVYRLAPLMRQKTIHFSEIKDWQVRPIKPLSEYGGYGWRVTPTSRAYILAGQHALIIEPQNGKKIAISTKNPEAVAAACQKEWQRYKEQNP